ncbi:MAG: porin, partial [Burkholderiales bacterium]|nr:porin [Burkholderiales bacterium]
MNKKLMAVAVAGALAAPAVVFAQASTVQLYGTFNAEYGVQVKQPATGANNVAGAPGLALAGRSRDNADGLGSGASNLGFKGEEKLGGGMSAWFQCESDVRFLGGSARTSGSICDRNSAIGLKGGFGNVFVGTWDSPIKQASGKTRMLNETGWLGAQHMLLAGSEFSFSNRNSDSINYQSPKFGGATINAQFTSTKAAMQQSAVSSSSVATTVAASQIDSTDAGKGREIGIGVDWTQGPITLAAAYSKQDENRASASASTKTSKDTAWLIGGTYTMGQFKGGLTYTDLKGDDGIGGDVKRKSWNVALQYNLTGPGSILFGYTRAGEYKVAGGGGENTGAKQWQIGYTHALSKRTSAGVSYVRLNNDSAGFYNLTPLNSSETSVK